MAKTCGINGFGRIGRMFFRVAMNYPELEIVGFNDLFDPKLLAHLLKFDSVQGNLNKIISATDNSIIVDGKEFPVTKEKDPAKIPWGDWGAQVVVESTGVFRNKEKCQPHLDAGAQKVVISAPSDSVDVTLVPGVNWDMYNPDEHVVISMASCTTNCLAPMVKVVNDNFSIVKGWMTTVHSYTQDQRLVESPHEDLRRARSAAINLIPTTTGAAKAIGEVIPALKGKLDGISIRAPTPTGSITDLSALVESDTTYEEVNAALKAAAEGEMMNVIEYSTDELVTSDVVGNPVPCIIDSKLTKVIGGNLVKVFGWYDNEIGYSTQLVKCVIGM